MNGGVGGAALGIGQHRFAPPTGHRADRRAHIRVQAIKNLNFLGSGYGYAKWLCWGDLLIFLVGLGYAFWLKSNNRAKYETIGRMINQGIDSV